MPQTADFVLERLREWARHMKIRNGMQASLSGTLATMGPGVPYAIAARFAFPGRPVIAFEGDGEKLPGRD
jgi:thiamine pyrophosphate-dependent acetolactate synthase large subunit-like protein